MKSPTEVRQRIAGLLVEELQRRTTEAQERLPHLCANNYRHGLDARKTVNGEPNEDYNRTTSKRRGLPVLQTVGLCMVGSEDPETWSGTICEDPIDAKTCPMFTPRVDKDTILLDFQEDLQTVEWVKDNLPEVYALTWVLQFEPVRLPWWTRIWYWFLRIRLEPVKAKTNLPQLLGEAIDDPVDPQ